MTDQSAIEPPEAQVLPPSRIMVLFDLHNPGHRLLVKRLAMGLSAIGQGDKAHEVWEWLDKVQIPNVADIEPDIPNFGQIERNFLSSPYEHASEDHEPWPPRLEDPDAD